LQGGLPLLQGGGGIGKLLVGGGKVGLGLCDLGLCLLGGGGHKGRVFATIGKDAGGAALLKVEFFLVEVEGFFLEGV